MLKFKIKEPADGRTVVIITGLPGSGTTLFNEMLGMSPHIYKGFELGLLRIQKIEKEEIKWWAEKGCVNFHRGDKYNLSEVNRMNHCADFESLYHMVHKAMQRWSPEGGNILLDKYPNYDLSMIRKKVNFPILFIYRDPRSLYVSNQKRIHLQTDLEKFTQNYEVYNNQMFAIDNLLPIQFEQLVLQPEKTIKTVCEFAGIPYVEDMLRPDLRPSHNMKITYQSNEDGWPAMESPRTLTEGIDLSVLYEYKKLDQETCDYIVNNVSPKFIFSE